MLSCAMHAVPTDYQVSLMKTDPNPHVTMLLQPIFTQGVSHYLKDTFNTPLYAQEILPNNFFHLIELLQHGIETNKPKVYFKSVLRLFTNKLKSTSYINAYAFADLTTQMTPLMQNLFIIDASKAFESTKDIINEMLLSTLVAKFTDFKANPGTFLEVVSQDIEDAMELRSLLMLFLETALNKLIWSPQEHIQTWECVKKIGYEFQTFYKKGMIVNQDDLNNLYISLVERYCFFLDITHSQLPVTFYQKVKDDVHTGLMCFLELPEQEKYLETKSQRLLRAVFEGEAKARSRQEGILV